MNSYTEPEELPVGRQIAYPVESLSQYFQCTPPPPAAFDKYPKSCNSSLTCFPNICCLEGGQKHCRPPKRNILAAITTFGQRFNVGWIRDFTDNLVIRRWIKTLFYFCWKILFMRNLVYFCRQLLSLDLNTFMMVKPPTRWLVPSHGELLNPAKMRNNVISKIDCKDQCQTLSTFWFINKILTFLNPMSLEYSRKHWRQRFNPYFRIIPWLFEQARLKWKKQLLVDSTWND